MKKTILCLVIATLMLISIIPVSAADNYTKADYSVPLDSIFGVGTVSVVESTTFDNRPVLKITKGTDEDEGSWIEIGQSHPDGWSGSATNAEKNLSVRYGDYKYIVIKQYVDLHEGTELGAGHKPYLALTKTDNSADAAWCVQGTMKSDDSLKGQLTDAGVYEDCWDYMIFDLTAQSSKVQDGNDTIIKVLQYNMYANGAGNNSKLTDEDATYLQFVTFTNDYVALITADKAADVAIDEAAKNEENKGDDNANTPNGDSNADVTPAPETKAPETTAPDTTEAKKDDETKAEEEKSGCGSVIGFAVVPVALVAGGACLIKRKKKED